MFCVGTSRLVPHFHRRYEESLVSDTTPPSGYFVRILAEEGPPFFAVSHGPVTQRESEGEASEEAMLKVHYLVPAEDPKFYARGLSADAPLPQVWRLSSEEDDQQPVSCIDEWGQLFEPTGGLYRLREEDELLALEHEGDMRDAAAKEVLVRPMSNESLATPMCSSVQSLYVLCTVVITACTQTSLD